MLDQLQQLGQGFNDWAMTPGAAMVGAGMQNMMAAQGMQGVNPFQAMQQARYQNQQLMSMRANQLDRQQEREQLRRLRELQMQKTQLDIEKGSDPMFEFRKFVESRPELQELPYQDQLQAYATFQRAAMREPSTSALGQNIALLESKTGKPATADDIWRMVRGPYGYGAGGGQQEVMLPDGSTRVLTPAEVATMRDATAAAAKAQASEVGRAEGVKVSKASGQEQGSNKVIELIDMARNHPGRAAATGFSSIGNVAPLPGSERKDFLVLHKQLTGNAFLQAYQQLKGGGPITDREGQVATQAQNRLDTAQSEEAYLMALDEMEADMMMLLEEAQTRQGKGGGSQSGQPTPTHRFNPATGRVEPIQ